MTPDPTTTAGAVLVAAGTLTCLAAAWTIWKDTHR